MSVLCILILYCSRIRSQALPLQNMTFDEITTENITFSKHFNPIVCNISNEQKTQCGFDAITEDQCIYQGCCWYHINNNTNNYPSCYYTNNIQDSINIGWIKMISCTESYNKASFTYHYDKSDLLNFEKYAITIKIVPPGNKTDPYYGDLAVMTVPCSNPVFSLNNNKELSCIINSDYTIIDKNNNNNWIGNNVALNRLNNQCTNNQQAESFMHIIYHARSNPGLHIFPNQSLCQWEFDNNLGHDIDIYFGFDVNNIYYCSQNTPSPTHEPTTFNPTTFNPTAAVTNKTQNNNNIELIVGIIIGILVLIIIIFGIIWKIKLKLNKEQQKSNQHRKNMNMNEYKIEVGKDIDIKTANKDKLSNDSDNNNQNINDGEYDEHILKVKEWLTNCKLPQYFNNFLQNGYSSLDTIELMNDKSFLEEIGINLVGHRTKIWGEIRKLQNKSVTPGRGQDDNQTNTFEGNDENSFEIVNEKEMVAYITEGVSNKS